ncbi:MAG TPA: hypothetical protein VKF80_03245 [Candidatus Eisenbacteria bacterium]|nr:hypothetical protein [Candidatus Eisenbacteria bacterium]
MRLVRRLAALLLVTLMAGVGFGCKSDLPPSTFANMGGLDGLTKYMSAWTDTMSANPELTKSLTADDMKMVARGFGNEVAKAAEIPMPSAGVDLVSVLKGKHLSAAQLTAMGSALQSAGSASMLSPDAMKGVMELWNGVVKHVK